MKLLVFRRCSAIITLTISQSRRHWHMIILSIIAQHRPQSVAGSSSRKNRQKDATRSRKKRLRHPSLTVGLSGQHTAHLPTFLRHHLNTQPPTSSPLAALVQPAPGQIFPIRGCRRPSSVGPSYVLLVAVYLQAPCKMPITLIRPHLAACKSGCRLITMLLHTHGTHDAAAA
jgi:hypothetical protein